MDASVGGLSRQTNGVFTESLMALSTSRPDLVHQSTGSEPAGPAIVVAHSRAHSSFASDAAP
jgi:hypothetical protein